MDSSAQEIGRRGVLGMLAAGAAALGALAWGLTPACVRAAVAKHFPTRTVERPEFRFDPATGRVNWTDGRSEPYRFRIDGLVEKPLTFSYAELRALPQDRGAPARVVCPFDLAYKSIKFVTRLELTDRAVAGWWTRANPVYPVHAPVDAGRLRRPDPRRS